MWARIYLYERLEPGPTGTQERPQLKGPDNVRGSGSHAATWRDQFGHSIAVVTKHGVPVARVVPIDSASLGSGSVTLLADDDSDYFSSDPATEGMWDARDRRLAAYARTHGDATIEW